MNRETMTHISRQAEAVFARHGVRLTLGGEPTFVPIRPEGPEWNFAAVGPTKLGYALKMAARLSARGPLKGAAKFYCPGKLYPGEVNPRWVIRLIANRDGRPLWRPAPARTAPGAHSARPLAAAICKNLGVPSHWVRFKDARNPHSEILAMPLDHEGGIWHSARWPLPPDDAVLSEAEGVAGLRLPLHRIPEGIARRAISIERSGGTHSVFFPPLLQEPFLELLAATETAARHLGIRNVDLQGYAPSDEAHAWTVLGLTADPGVLEVNVPAAASWEEYAAWIERITYAAEKSGLRSWKEPDADHPQGSGGGNHLLWGGPTIEQNPFFARPKWLASVIRFWQHHPSLAYMFTGSYVGASSQAPRPDESARDLYDIDMAYAFLESLPPGDHRELINETLRHIHIDVTGNSHRSEISFDKFWTLSSPSGALGLIEFRAIEALPRLDWACSVVLLWTCLAARCLEARPAKGLKRFGASLLDEYFLPAVLWHDFSDVLGAVRDAGFALEDEPYRSIWDWRFPVLLQWGSGDTALTARRAHESWPLLSETPVEGGTTSRFVDTSMHRIEFAAGPGWTDHHTLYVAGRPLPLQPHAAGLLAGLRYRRTNLYPALHPGIPTQLPLHVTIVENASVRPVAEFVMGSDDIVFHPLRKPGAITLTDKTCRGGRKGDMTCDLRLE